ncbi:hypothetical protein CI610_02106 [invertebrate metagenome]|uniref:SnoaL-like domain-containing protein n=1 Tax=invertebrate metagenome TaxID=1711999 RepID=A0A2H9T6X2_9ZZZZ
MGKRLTGKALKPFEELLAFIDQASEQKDTAAMMSCFVSENDIISFGHTASLNSRSELEQHWKNYFKDHTPDYSRKRTVVVYQSGSAACMCITQYFEETQSKTERITLFLENHHGQWLIRHRHHSPCP